MRRVRGTGLGGRRIEYVRPEAPDTDYFFGAFFFPATARREPLRVRALVWVR
jgi:hypothetical protein